MSKNQSIVVSTLDIPEGYELVQLIGEGHYGQVYRVYSQRDGKEYAMKIVPFDERSSQKRRFLSECLAHSYLSSAENGCNPNIICMHDHIETETTGYLVLELMDGDLKRWVPPNLLSVIIMMTEVMRALRCMHENGLAHRDVKPANIMWKRASRRKSSDASEICPRIQWKLGDLGLTCAGKCGAAGTPLYIAPEFSNRRRFNVSDVMRADIYSAGIVFREFLIRLDRNKLLDRRANRHSILHGSRVHTPAPRTNSTVAHILMELVAGMTDTRPDRRLSADECVQILERLQNLQRSEMEAQEISRRLHWCLKAHGQGRNSSTHTWCSSAARLERAERSRQCNPCDSLQREIKHELQAHKAVGQEMEKRGRRDKETGTAEHGNLPPFIQKCDGNIDTI